MWGLSCRSWGVLICRIPNTVICTTTLGQRLHVSHDLAVLFCTFVDSNRNKIKFGRHRISLKHPQYRGLCVLHLRSLHLYSKPCGNRSTTRLFIYKYTKMNILCSLRARLLRLPLILKSQLYWFDTIFSNSLVKLLSSKGLVWTISTATAPHAPHPKLKL